MKYFFKYHIPSKHYALIVSKSNGKYEFLLLSHSQKEKMRNNLLLSYNPNLADTRQAYIQKYIRCQSVRNFSKKEAKHLQLSPEDELLVTKFLETKKTNKEQTEDNEPERER